LNKRGISVLETFEKGNTFVDGFKSEVVFFAVSLISSLSLFSFTGSFGHFMLGHVNQSFIGSDESFESFSFWVEGVLEMGSGNTESDLGISESGIDFLVELVMLSGSPSVFFLLRTEFEVKISDEVLEGGDQFIHWAFSLNL